MAAYVVCLTKQEWKVLSSILGRLEEGGIILTPDAQKEYVDEYDEDPPDGELIEYDFGGEADVLVDVVDKGRVVDHTHPAVDAIRDHVVESEDSDE